MNENTTISWIFLATALASQKDPASFESISQIADGINHAVPTHKELQKSLTWLTKNGMVNKIGKKYQLTSTGTEAIDKAKARTTNVVLNIWDELKFSRQPSFKKCISLNIRKRFTIFQPFQK